MKSGATAISSDMLFGEEEKKAAQPDRWSTPAAISTIGEKIQGLSRQSFGSKYCEPLIRHWSTIILFVIAKNCQNVFLTTFLIQAAAEVPT